MRRQKRIKLIQKSSVLCEATSAYCKYNMHVNMVIIACTHLWVQQQMLPAGEAEAAAGSGRGDPGSLPSKEPVGSVMTILNINTTLHTLHITPVREKLI